MPVFFKVLAVGKDLDISLFSKTLENTSDIKVNCRFGNSERFSHWGEVSRQKCLSLFFSPVSRSRVWITPLIPSSFDTTIGLS